MLRAQGSGLRAQGKGKGKVHGARCNEIALCETLCHSVLVAIEI